MQAAAQHTVQKAGAQINVALQQLYAHPVAYPAKWPSVATPSAPQAVEAHLSGMEDDTSETSLSAKVVNLLAPVRGGHRSPSLVAPN